MSIDPASCPNCAGVGRLATNWLTKTTGLASRAKGVAPCVVQTHQWFLMALSVLPGSSFAIVAHLQRQKSESSPTRTRPWDRLRHRNTLPRINPGWRRGGGVGGRTCCRAHCELAG